MLKKFIVLVAILSLLMIGAVSADNTIKLPELKFSGAVDVDLKYNSRENQADESKIEISNVSFSVESKLNEKMSAYVLFYWEESYGGGNVDVDEARLDWAVCDKLNLKIGRFYMPFGNRSTLLISDPLVTDLSEYQASAIQADYKALDVLTLKAAIFNADIDENEDYNDHIRDFSLAAAYSQNSLNLELSYISNIARFDNTNFTTGWLTGSTEKRGSGLDLFASYKVDKVTLLGEYLTSVSDPKTATFKRDYNVYNLEVGYAVDEKWNIAGKIEQGKAKTSPVSGAATTTLKVNDYAVGCDYALFTNTALKFEYQHSKRQNTGVATTKSDNFTACISYNF